MRYGCEIVPGSYNPPTMFRLTREVRFAINSPASRDPPVKGKPDPQLSAKPVNSYAGHPALVGLGRWYALQIALIGPLDEQSNYLCDIKQIDAAVRQRAIPYLADQVESPDATAGTAAIGIFHALQTGWFPAHLDSIRLSVSPFQHYSVHRGEIDMFRLSQTFEFSATHRLHNPKLSDAENRQTFGKCNNPHGHGHNYRVQVTVASPAAESAIDVLKLERIVNDAVIEKFDHKNLNVELPEFHALIPSVENIAMTIYRLLKDKLGEPAKLALVTVWETPKTWCEYSE
jgi:6-pyruvoyltetrahydropterin/6-carboxytetrahydropterin synthase